MVRIWFVPCIPGPAKYICGGGVICWLLGEYWIRICFGGQGVVHLLLFVFSLLAILNRVCSLATVDWPAANFFEIAEKNIRAVETRRFGAFWGL